MHYIRIAIYLESRDSNRTPLLTHTINDSTRNQVTPVENKLVAQLE